MLVGSVMSTPVLSAAPSTPIREAAWLMLTHRFSALPVVNNEDVLVGIVSEGDLLRRRELGTERLRPRWLEFFVSPAELAEEYSRSCGRIVGEVMTSKVITIAPEATLAEAVELMTSQHVKRLPVLKDGRMAGIIARSDVLRALARSLPIAPCNVVEDDAIRTAIIAELGRQEWGSHAKFDVAVNKGVVTLSGCILGEREGLAARVLAENMPGVKAVIDRLEWRGRGMGNSRSR
jgi:CBS domain-containing protein